MDILKYYYEIIIKHDLINKFHYSNIKKIPKLKRIVLSFGCNSSQLKDLTPALLSLELLTEKKSNLSKSKQANIVLKIKKGQPIGCYIPLTGTKMYKFLFILLVKVFPALKDFKGIPVDMKNLHTNTISFSINDLTVFKELNTHFYFYNKLPPLSITLVTNTNTKDEFIYLLQSFSTLR